MYHGGEESSSVSYQTSILDSPTFCIPVSGSLITLLLIVQMGYHMYSNISTYVTPPLLKGGGGRGDNSIKRCLSGIMTKSKFSRNSGISSRIFGRDSQNTGKSQTSKILTSCLPEKFPSLLIPAKPSHSRKNFVFLTKQAFLELTSPPSSSEFTPSSCTVVFKLLSSLRDRGAYYG